MINFFRKKEHLSNKELKSRKNRFILSENEFLRYFTFSSLYVAQGIPEGMIFFAIPAWLAMNGKSPAEIGAFVAVIGIPWSFKILVAPLMDRFTYLPMGRKRPWIIIGQLGLIISLLAASLINEPLNNLNILMVAGFFISFFGAFQDVAVDGMAIDILPINQQARANGLMWGSKTVGTSLSLAISTWIINAHGFASAVIFLSVAVMCIILIPIFFRENIDEKIMPWTKGLASKISLKKQMRSWKVIFKSLFKVFFLPTSLLMGVAVFINSIGNGLMDTLLPVFTIQEIGWTNSDYSQIMATANIVAGLSGMFVGGALVDIYGKKRMMSIYLIALIILTISMAALSIYWPTTFFVPTFIISYYILYTFLTIAIFASAMELCWKRISATQFTLYMAISNLGRATGAGYLGFFKDFLIKWEYVILIYTVASLIMLMLLRYINFNKHLASVEALESSHLN